MEEKKWMGWARRAAVAAAAVWGAAAAGCELPSAREDLGALRLADRASGCLSQGEEGKAGRLFYAQAIRSRALAAIDPDPMGWAWSAKAVQEQLGGPVNRWLGGDVDEWIESIHWALAWDAAAPWSEGAREAARRGVDAGAPRAASRRALEKLVSDLKGLDREKLRQSRKAAGLGYRGAAKR